LTVIVADDNSSAVSVDSATSRNAPPKKFSTYTSAPPWPTKLTVYWMPLTNKPCRIFAIVASPPSWSHCTRTRVTGHADTYALKLALLITTAKLYDKRSISCCCASVGGGVVAGGGGGGGGGGGAPPVIGTGHVAIVDVLRPVGQMQSNGA